MYLSGDIKPFNFRTEKRKLTIWQNSRIVGFIRQQQYKSCPCSSRWPDKTVELNSETPEEVLSPKSYVDVPADLRKSYFLYILYTNFLPNYQLSIPFSIEKPPNFAQIVCCLLKFAQTQFLNLSSFVSDKKTLDRYTKFCGKSAPKGRHIIRIPC